ARPGGAGHLLRSLVGLDQGQGRSRQDGRRGQVAERLPDAEPLGFYRQRRLQANASCHRRAWLVARRPRAVRGRAKKEKDANQGEPLGRIACRSASCQLTPTTKPPTAPLPSSTRSRTPKGNGPGSGSISARGKSRS